MAASGQASMELLSLPRPIPNTYRIPIDHSKIIQMLKTGQGSGNEAHQKISAGVARRN